MNRVRIVALAAVTLGAVVTAGTKFQQAQQDQGSEAAAELNRASVVPVDGERNTPPAGQQRADATGGSVPSLIGDTYTATPPVTASDTAPQDSMTDDSVRIARADEAVAPGATPGTGRSDTPLTDALNAQHDTRPAEQPSPAMQAPEAAPLDPELEAELAACAVWLVVTPSAGAMLETSVYAPCDGGAHVILSHSGLSFDATLGEDGQYLAQIPALTEEASVSIAFQDGRVEHDRTEVPDLADVERVVLQWDQPAELQLNAYEFGARYGSAGHVHAGAPRTAGVSNQGFVTVLGDPQIPGGQLAQVYSYPRGETPQTGTVTLEIEVPVTDASCGQSISARTIEVHGTRSAQIRNMQLDMPDCDGAGGFVVLPGVLPDLQIAQTDQQSN
ncbi:hypothetical protein [Pararhodobacter marinus]|uniref:hypothetical protein n=1 Tax=Pararhodobacter marinus TaxID=2184063 RepID=UPI003519CE4C